MPVTIAHPQKRVEVISPAKLSATKGTILIQENFEDTVKWTTTLGTGAKSTTAVKVFDGTNSWKQITLGSGAFTCESNRLIPINFDVSNSKLGLEFYVMMEQASNMTSGFNIKFTLYSSIGGGVSDTGYTFGINYIGIGTPKTQFWNDSGGWTNILTKTLESNVWYRVKIVVNLKTQTYEVVEIGDRKIEVSTKFQEIANASALMKGILEIACESDGATQRNIYWDNITLSFNEP